LKPKSYVLAWDVVVRLLHWALAVLITIDLVRDDGDYTHRMIGYAAVVVVLLRLTWAAFSRSHGGLAELKPSLSLSIHYLRLLVRRRAPRPVGHNPLGMWMVWLVWLLVLLLGLTGWMSRLDAFWGDDDVHGAHAFLAGLLLYAVILHLVGVGAMSWLWKENLASSMITGLKRHR
jgi:cytochrome b